MKRITNSFIKGLDKSPKKQPLHNFYIKVLDTERKGDKIPI